VARRLEVEIVGDSRSLERAFDRSARSARSFSQEMAGAERNLVKVGAARGKALGGLRIAGVGLAAGFAISSTTRAVSELSGALEVTGEEAETFTGRIRNMAAEILRGDLVGAFIAMTRETKNFTQAQIEAIAVLPRATDIYSKLLPDVKQSAEATAAALAAIPAIAETPSALQLAEARAAMTGRKSDDITVLDWKIANARESLARIKKFRSIAGTSEGIEAGIAALLGKIKGWREEQNKYIDDMNKGARKRGAAAIETITGRRERRLERFLGGIDRRMFREVEGQPLRAQAAALGAIAETIRGQIQITKGTERRAQLEDRLIAVLRQQKDVYAQINDEIEAANQLLQDRADAIKSAVLERLERRRTDVLNRRALADAKEALRIARLIGGPKGIQEARRGLQDVQYEMLRARVERAPARLTRGGQFMLGGVITINVNGVTDPEKVAAAVAAALQRRMRRARRQRRGLPTAGA
jgi:hypothetical protein